MQRLAARKASLYICPSMRIRLASLHPGVNSVEETVDPGNLGLEDSPFHSPIHVTGEIDNEETFLTCHLTIDTVASLVCDRCAIDFEEELTATTRVIIMRRDPYDEDERESEGLVFVGGRGEEADLSQELIDAIVLELPFHPLCQDDCKGLCPQCGADLNEGPCEHVKAS